MLTLAAIRLAPIPLPLVLLAAVLSAPAYAATKSRNDTSAAADPRHEEDLRALEQRLERERAAHDALRAREAEVENELAALRTKLVAAAARVQDYEETLSALETRLAELRSQDTKLRDALARRDDQVVQVLTAIQRLAWRPTEALLAQPMPPADTVRSAILLRSAIPRIEQDAKDIVEELRRLHDIDVAMRAQRAQIKVTGDQLRSEHGSLRGLIDEKRALSLELAARDKETADRVAAMGREAKDMRDLIARLEEERKRRAAEEEARRLAAEAEARRIAAEQAAAAEARRLAALAEAAKPKPDAPSNAAGLPDPTVSDRPVQTAAAQPPAPSRPPPEVEEKAFEDARGAMPFPARGHLVGRYGEKTELGDTLRGLRVETRSGAQVVAPHGGTVAFAGPFRGYGNLLIIEHGGGYHTLLAGLGRIDAVVGQRLSAGEPIGVMADGASPTLYVELRRKGQPINPLPWLTASKGNASG